MERPYRPPQPQDDPSRKGSVPWRVPEPPAPQPKPGSNV